MLVEGQQSDAQIAELLIESSRLFAEVLESPIDRVRVSAQLVKPQHIAIGGKLVSEGVPSTPYFEFVVLEGRPMAHRHRLLEGFTKLLVDTLGVDGNRVRGSCWAVDPAQWSIGGTLASVMRAKEISARAAANAAAGSTAA
jgi:4-oxalocrotonate tautomerase